MKLNLTEEEMEKMVEEFVKYELERQKENERFILNDQDEILEKVYVYLKNEPCIDDEDILYFPEKYNFSGNEFQMLFYNLLNYADEKDIIGHEKDNYFPNENAFFIYKDLNILPRTMKGQGTMIQMRTDLPEFWDMTKSFSYEHAKKWLLSTCSDNK